MNAIERADVMGKKTAFEDLSARPSEYELERLHCPQFPQAWVLWWKHSDGSNQGILRVYKDEERAKEDFDLVKESSDRQYMLDAIPFFI